MGAPFLSFTGRLLDFDEPLRRDSVGKPNSADWIFELRNHNPVGREHEGDAENREVVGPFVVEMNERDKQHQNGRKAGQEEFGKAWQAHFLVDQESLLVISNDAGLDIAVAPEHIHEHMPSDDAVQYGQEC